VLQLVNERPTQIVFSPLAGFGGQHDHRVPHAAREWYFYVLMQHYLYRSAQPRLGSQALREFTEWHPR